MLKNQHLAGLLSFLLPGMGQIYNGHFWRGLFWLVVTPGLWLGTGGFLGWVCHLVSAYTAHQKSREVADPMSYRETWRIGRGLG